MIFCSQFKFNGNFALQWFNYWPSDCNNFFTCHNRTAVMSCAKFCSDQFVRIEVRAKQNFHWIWIVIGNLFVKWAPVCMWLSLHCLSVDVHFVGSSLTHSGRDKMAATLADDIFKCIFFNENEWILLKISLKFVPKFRINNIPALVQIMAWHRPGDKP